MSRKNPVWLAREDRRRNAARSVRGSAFFQLARANSIARNSKKEIRARSARSFLSST